MTVRSKIIALAGAPIIALFAVPACAADGVSLGEHGLSLASGDGAIRLDLGGRLQVDSVAEYGEPAGALHATKFRRARLELSGDLGERLQFRVDHEFAGTAGWRNVWASYRVNHDLQVKAGNFIAPFSLEDLQSSNATTFVERSLANTLAPGYGLGVDATLHRRGWTASAGWFGDPIKNDDGSRRRRGAGLVARLTYAPVMSRSDTVHLGAAVEHRSLPAGGLHVQTGPEAAFTPSLIHSRGLANASAFTNAGLEAAWIHGPFLAQGQLIETWVDRAGAPAARLRGGYLQGSWILTGQSYDYSRSSGAIGGVKLEPGRQALEVAVRYGVLDLNSRDARGGVGRDLTVGVNWYVNRNVRVMADYIRASAEVQPLLPNRTADIFGFRLQTSF